MPRRRGRGRGRGPLSLAAAPGTSMKERGRGRVLGRENNKRNMPRRRGRGRGRGRGPLSLAAAPGTGLDSEDDYVGHSSGHDSEDDYVGQTSDDALLDEEYALVSPSQEYPDEETKRKQAIDNVQKMVNEIEEEIKTWIFDNLRHRIDCEGKKEKEIMMELRKRSLQEYGPIIFGYILERVQGLRRIFLLLPEIWDASVVEKVLEITRKFEEVFFLKLQAIEEISHIADVTLRDTGEAWEKEIKVAYVYKKVSAFLCTFTSKTIERCVEDEEEPFKSCMLENLKEAPMIL